MARRPRFALAVAALLLPSAALADIVTHENARFGTRASFPAELFQSRMELPTNSDGITWTAEDGGSLAIYGMYNALMVSPSELLEETAGETPLTYSNSGEDWAVASGVEDGTVFYQRWLFGSDDVIHAILLRYPVGLKDKYDPLAGPIAESLSGP